MPSGVKGDDTPGFIDGVTFLRNVSLGENVKLGNRVGITGGGNSAVDCARTALRLGAKKVIMFYRRTRVEMPAAPEEVEEALHEGVEIVFLVAPNEIRKRADGALDFECTRMKLGEPDASGRRRPEPIPGSEFVTILDNVISGIGQATDIPSGFGLDTGRGNVIRVKGNSLETTLRGVFAGGDIVTGPASVIGAISHGRQAASEIDKYLGGNGIITEALLPEEAADPYFGEDAGFTERYQPAMPCIPDNQRTASFIEVELGYGEKTAAEEAARCFRCNMRLKINAPVLPPAKVVTARTED
jgi:formate dehydrogenase major subunit